MNKRAEAMRQVATTHGMYKHPLYMTWKSMRQRVQRDPHYVGITICERWDHFPNFAEDMGEQAVGMTLDRIDFNGNYEPTNCRWATPKEQAINRRTTTMITHAGKTMCISDWAKEIGLSRKGLAQRFALGWSIDRALVPKIAK